MKDHKLSSPDLMSFYALHEIRPVALLLTCRAVTCCCSFAVVPPVRILQDVFDGFGGGWGRVQVRVLQRSDGS
jgi:hypothetical protein